MAASGNRFRRWLHRGLFPRRWLTFIVLCLSFFVFGAGSLNLFFLLKASATLVIDNGWQALMDGAAMQLAELLLTGAISMTAYVLFKACEYSLVHWIIDEEAPHGVPVPPPVSTRSQKPTR